jgi:hypothetical protein
VFLNRTAASLGERGPFGLTSPVVVTPHHTPLVTQDPRRTHRGFSLALTLLCGSMVLLGWPKAAQGYSPTDTDKNAVADKPTVDNAATPKLSSSTARGETAGKDDGNDNGAEVAPYDHSGQFNLRVSFVGGYRMFFRYPKSPYCTQPDLAKGGEQQKLCGYGAPFALDVAAGFAPIAGLEPFLWGRFGLGKESKTDTKPLLILGGGVRIYTMEDSPIKVYLEPSIGVELEGSGGNPAWAPIGLDIPEYKTDVIGRFVVGPQFEVSRNVGLYFAGGLTLGVLRAIHSTMELEAGIQARFP